MLHSRSSCSVRKSVRKYKPPQKFSAPAKWTVDKKRTMNSGEFQFISPTAPMRQKADGFQVRAFNFGRDKQKAHDCRGTVGGTILGRSRNPDLPASKFLGPSFRQYWPLPPGKCIPASRNTHWPMRLSMEGEGRERKNCCGQELAFGP